MEKAAALKIIQQLADGIDPQTGQAFGADSPYQHPDTVRALFVALRALDAPPASKQRAAATGENAPSNSGKPWSDDEDKALAAAFDAGRKIPRARHRAPAFAVRDRSAARQARQDRAARQYARACSQGQRGRVGHGGLFSATLIEWAKQEAGRGKGASRRSLVEKAEPPFRSLASSRSLIFLHDT